MIKGRRRLESEKNDLDNKLAVNRERQREIRARYGGVSKIMNVRDQSELDRLEDEARVVSRQLESIDECSGTRWQRISRLLRPFEFIFGAVLLAFSLALTSSIFLTIVDKIMDTSICGSKCGYVIHHPELFNPVNFIFVKLAKVFPLDYLFMVILIVYFFLATLTGIVSLGVRFFWITFFRIRRNATMPQGLLILTVLLTLGLLAVNYSLTSVVAPGYAHFGSQVYCNRTIETVRDCSSHPEAIVACDIYGPTDICTPTVTSTFVDRIIVSTPFFGIVYYYAQWAFLLIFSISFLIGLFRKPRNNIDVESEDVDADDEHDPLLQSPSNHRGGSSSYLTAS
ncbi:hypothetical protein BX666DRAFT_1906684 [Dichotomocladium elegans]|nr:hypothetical protein BX666DRAFT_1906684 [Dichotomocladium elegans]